MLKLYSTVVIFYIDVNNFVYELILHLPCTIILNYIFSIGTQ